MGTTKLKWSDNRLGSLFPVVFLFVLWDFSIRCRGGILLHGIFLEIWIWDLLGLLFGIAFFLLPCVLAPSF